MSSFYCTPVGVGHTLYKHAPINGKILIPYDHDGILSKELKLHGLDVTCNQEEQKVLDPWWWNEQKQQEYDYVVNCNYGLKEVSDYILKYSLSVAKQGVAFLDRISFIEPTQKRRDFLLAHQMSHMIVLSPRPVYRALNNLKDSVTSAWFIFHDPEYWKNGSIITYAVSWADLPDLEDVAQNRSVIQRDRKE